MATAAKRPQSVVQRWLPILLLGAIVGSGSTWLTQADHEKWLATAEIQIRDAGVLPDTAAVMLQSPSTWREIAAAENVETDEFLRSIDAAPVGQSAVVKVSYSSADKSQASRIVEGVVESFVDRSAPPPIDEQIDVIDQHLTTLHTRRIELENGLEEEVDLVVANRKKTRLHAVNSWITQAQLLVDDNKTQFASKARDVPVVLSFSSVTRHPESTNRNLNIVWGGLVGLLAASLVGYVSYPPDASALLAARPNGTISETSPTYPPVGSAAALVTKRAFDIVLGTFGLVILSPILVVLAVSVKSTSAGPVLFRQERIGHRGQPFLINKFRTMNVVNDDSEHRKFVTSMLVDDADEVAQAEDGIFKLDDPRVTKIGGFLRSYSLDELPQLWNVVKGEMSLIGPRPSLPWEHELYSNDLKQRVRSKPGCSGLWQVSGHNKLTVPEMLELDIEYVERWTVGLDLKILLRTPKAVFGRGHTR